MSLSPTPRRSYGRVNADRGNRVTRRLMGVYMSRHCVVRPFHAFPFSLLRDPYLRSFSSHSSPPLLTSIYSTRNPWPLSVHASRSASRSSRPMQSVRYPAPRRARAACPCSPGVRPTGVLGAVSRVQTQQKQRGVHVATTLRAEGERAFPFLALCASWLTVWRAAAVRKHAQARKDELGPHWSTWVHRAVNGLVSTPFDRIRRAILMGCAERPGPA
jgi:hypothetical protein